MKYLLILLFVAGCAASVESANPKQVTVNLGDTIDFAGAQNMADQHCSQFGKFAVKTSTLPNRIIYSCEK